MTTQTKFFVNGSDVHSVQLNEDTTYDKLPPQIYTVKDHPIQGFYLTIFKDKLTVPEKIYGVAEARIDKCLRTFNERSTSTGILLTGDKGSGKTLLTAVLANKVVEIGIPVVLINEPYNGERFSNFIASLGPICLVFDEFVKTYSRNISRDELKSSEGQSQNALLTIMDGLDKVKRLIVLTENEEHSINSYMIDRPSRLYYHFRYGKMDEASIAEYCADKAVKKEATTEIIELSRLTKTFSFDILQTIVEEHLRYDGTIKEIIEDLNITIRNQIRTKEVIKSVIRISDSAVCTVAAQQKIIQKPIRHATTIVQFKTPELLAETNKEKLEALLDSYNPFQNCDVDHGTHTIHLYLQPAHIKYQSGTKTIYETTEFIIATETQEEIPESYAKYLVF